jgi:hypothetical protein
VYLALLLAAGAIIAGVVVVAMGRGGELRLVRRDLPDARFRLRTPEDVAMLQLPLGLLGYQEHATSDALRAVARLLDDRDMEIARLRDEVRRLRSAGAAAVPGPPDAVAGEAMSARNAGLSQPSAQS